MARVFGCSGGVVVLLSSVGMAASATLGAPSTLSGVPADFVHPDDQTTCYTCGKLAALAEGRMPTADFGGPDEVVPPALAPREPMGATDVLHHDLDFEIFPFSGEIAGTNTMTVRSEVNGLSEFTFRLRSNYAVTAASVDGVPASVTSIDTVSRRVNFPSPRNAGEMFDVSITYEGPAMSRGFGSIEFDSAGGQPIVASLSQPYYAYTWWATKDHEFGVPGDNSDKATADIAVTAPSSMRSVANGVLEGVDSLSGGRSRYRWSTDYEAPTYLFAFGSHPYNTWTRTFDYADDSGSYSMPVEFNIYPSQDSPANRMAWDRTLDMLEVFSDLFGLYPFIDEKYGIYQFPFGGGMEHQTNSGQSGFGASLTAHELGHQWWGDSITCENWSHIWLNEGFASYCEALWEEFKNGSSNSSALQSAMLARVPDSSTDSLSVFVPANQTDDLFRIFGSTSYLKGGWVLHMLRWTLGDETFFDVLRQYRANHEGGTAVTEDLADAVMQVTGADYSGFFDDWIYGTGRPDYRYAWSNVSIDGQPYAQVAIRQAQSTSRPTFEMPIEAQFSGGAGNASFRLMQTSRPTQHFLVPLSGSASGMTLDPDNWLLAYGQSQSGLTNNAPPKILGASFADGETFEDAPATLAVFFSDDVSAATGDFELVGPGGLVIATASTAGNEVTLTPVSTLEPGAYTLIVRDSITAGGIALDGEFPGTQIDGLSLPSGDGLAGGDASFAFTIAAPVCPADLNGDGVLNNSDINLFVNLFIAQDAATDLNGDGAWNNTDINLYVAAFIGGC